MPRFISKVHRQHSTHRRNPNYFHEQYTTAGKLVQQFLASSDANVKLTTLRHLQIRAPFRFTVAKFLLVNWYLFTMRTLLLLSPMWKKEGQYRL